MKHGSRLWGVFLFLCAGLLAAVWGLRHRPIDPTSVGTSPVVERQGTPHPILFPPPAPLVEHRGPAGALRRSSPKRAPEPKVAAQTAQSLAHAGWGSLEAGDYQGAARIFTEASRLFPREASLLVGLGISRSRLHRYEEAVAALTHALSVNAEIEHAHALLGDLYFKLDELEKSVRHYEVACRQDPGDTAAQDGLFAVRRALHAEAPLHRIFSPHFIVKFNGSDHKLANEAIDRLERLHRVIGEQLGETLNGAMIVILYGDRRFEEDAGHPAWAVGLYDGRIHIAVQALMPSSKADGTLAHEYTHALVHRLGNGHVPTWLQEGLALYFEGRPASWSHDILLRRSHEIVPLHALHGSFLALPSHMVEMAYAEGYAATQAMVGRYGLASMCRLLETLAITPEFATAFERVFRKPYRDFEVEWTAGLMGRRT